jgi:hypothetical protein
MDRLLSRRLERDQNFRGRIVKMAKDYLRLGRDSLAYWSNDFDTAYDVMQCYSALSKQDFERLERSAPKRFILPMTATQITTMTTYIAQVLYGQDTPHKVEGRRPQDEIPAEFVNQLLRWNAEQQQMYNIGYLWIQDCVAVNRGIFYNCWAPIFKPDLQVEQVSDPEDVDPATNQPRTYPRPRRKNKVVGGYCQAHLVSPYDFICDPTLPIWRMDEMRFTGHRVVLPVTELRRRSTLPPEHPEFVMPWAVNELIDKAKKGIAQADAAVPSLPGVLPNPAEIRLSRTAYERTRALQPTGANQADKNDTGNVECWSLSVRLVPIDNELYENDTTGNEPVLFTILISGGDVLLSITESTYAHGHHPYSVAEGRPNAHFQFSPGWVMMLKGIQDYVDWLKNRHQEALTRTVGNIFVYDPQSIDVSDFMNPDKEGLLITIKQDAANRNIKDIFQQVPIKDLTENFHEEAMEFVKYSESVTAANSSMQGASPGGSADESATAYAGTQQMSAGRMTSVARLLSSQALVGQCKQFVSNFQQFMEHSQEVRFKGDVTNLPPDLQKAYSLNLNRDLIQGDFEFVAHDGTLPGTDARKVAAITRLLEGAAMFPQIFTPAPGNLDPRKLVMAAAKASGLTVENFCYSADAIPQPGPGGPPPPGAPPGPPGAPPGPPAGMQGPAPGLPTPGPKPGIPSLPNMAPPEPISGLTTRPKPANPV